MDAPIQPDDRAPLKLSEPRSVPQVLIGALELYRRYPALFFVLAAGVIAPYELIVLAATGTGLFARGSLAAGTSFFLTLSDIALIGPLISALHVHAVAAAGRGEDPRIGSVAIQGLRVLPVVAAATIIASLGTFVGMLALIVPGVILALRWVVVAQAAAIEHEGWLPALRRSGELTRGNYAHVFAFFICAGAILVVAYLLGGAAFGRYDTNAASFLVGLIVHVLSASFGALASALLFYDLLARRREAPAPQPVTETGS